MNWFKNKKQTRTLLEAFNESVMNANYEDGYLNPLTGCVHLMKQENDYKSHLAIPMNEFEIIVGEPGLFKDVYKKK